LINDYLKTSQELVGIEEIVFGSIAHVESGPNFLTVPKSRAVPALVNGVLAEIRQHLAPECISLPLETDHWFEHSRIFSLFGFLRLGTVALVSKADMGAGEAGIAVHQTVIIVRFAVGSANRNKIIGTGFNAGTGGFSVAIDATFTPSSTNHHVACI